MDAWDMLICGMSPAGMSIDAVEAKAVPVHINFSHHSMVDCAGFNTKIFVSLGQFDRMKAFLVAIIWRKPCMRINSLEPVSLGR